MNAIPDEKYEDETTEFNFTEDSNESVDNLQKHEKCQRLIKFEYHVLYHLSYAVPYLCFNAHDSSELKHIILSTIIINFNLLSPMIQMERC